MPIPTDTLRWTHLSLDTVDAWAELVAVLAQADGTGELYDAEDLAEELAQAGFTAETDSWAVFDGETMVAYGQLEVGLLLDYASRVRCQLSGGVHPSWRGRGIGRALLERMEARAFALASERHPGVSAYVRGFGGLEDSSARRMFAHRGYAVVRYFNDLARPLPGPALPEVPSDASLGAHLVSQESQYAEPTRLAHNSAFADHWGSAAITAAEWDHEWDSRSARPKISTLAIGPDGDVLAYVIAGRYVPGTLYIGIVGTVPQARGRGLAAACLTRTLALAAASGEYARAELGVDSTNPTGATRLYERLGFERIRTSAAMQRG